MKRLIISIFLSVFVSSCASLGELKIDKNKYKLLHTNNGDYNVGSTCEAYFTDNEYLYFVTSYKESKYRLDGGISIYDPKTSIIINTRMENFRLHHCSENTLDAISSLAQIDYKIVVKEELKLLFDKAITDNQKLPNLAMGKNAIISNEGVEDLTKAIGLLNRKIARDKNYSHLTKLLLMVPNDAYQFRANIKDLIEILNNNFRDSYMTALEPFREKVKEKEKQRREYEKERNKELAERQRIRREEMAKQQQAREILKAEVLNKSLKLHSLEKPKKVKGTKICKNVVDVQRPDKYIQLKGFVEDTSNTRIKISIAGLYSIYYNDQRTILAIDSLTLDGIPLKAGSYTWDDSNRWYLCI